MENSESNYLRQLAELTNLIAEKRISFHQNLLLAGAGLLGILVGLHTAQSSGLYIRLVFLLSIHLLLLGSLLSAIVVYDLIRLLSQLKTSFLEELQKSLHGYEEPEPVAVCERRRTKCCETGSIVSFVASLFLLVVYTTLSLLLP